MAWLNLFLLVLEFLTLSVCQYEFLSHNERAIYLKKGWYFLLFFVDYAALFAATTLTGADGRTPAAVGNLLSILVIIFGVPVMGAEPSVFTGGRQRWCWTGFTVCFCS